MENAYSRAKRIPIQQVKEKPSENTVRDLNEWRSDLRERLIRRLEEIDRQIAKQVERINRIAELKARVESAEK